MRRSFVRVVAGVALGIVVACGSALASTQPGPNGKIVSNFSIIISPGLQITTNSLPDGNVGVFYSANLAASGGVSPY